MENINLDSVLFGLVIAILVYKYFDARDYFRQEKQTESQITNDNIVRCEVEYDPNDPTRKMLYVFDRDNKQFLTQADSIKQAVINLIDQKYTTITLHPDHCPPEVFEASKKITINDFAKVKQ
jgi:fructose/tagatose bisphosphate aldolase